MTKDPWKDPDPQPGDFDEYLSKVDPQDVEYLEGSPGGELVVIDAAEADRLRKPRGADAAQTRTGARRRSR